MVSFQENFNVPPYLLAAGLAEVVVVEVVVAGGGAGLEVVVEDVAAVVEEVGAAVVAGALLGALAQAIIKVINPTASRRINNLRLSIFPVAIIDFPSLRYTVNGLAIYT